MIVIYINSGKTIFLGFNIRLLARLMISVNVRFRARISIRIRISKNCFLEVTDLLRKLFQYNALFESIGPSM